MEKFKRVIAIMGTASLIAAMRAWAPPAFLFVSISGQIAAQNGKIPPINKHQPHKSPKPKKPSR